jgi:hypothetical protein
MEGTAIAGTVTLGSAKGSSDVLGSGAAAGIMTGDASHAVEELLSAIE